MAQPQENLALQTQESKGLRIGEEKKFIASLQSKKLKDCSNQEISEALRYVMVKIGLRSQNWPNELEKLILIEHIQQEFGGHHLDEIRLAFDLAINRTIEAEVNCYENFSCLYFTNIMFAYRKWSKEAYAYYQRDIERPVTKQLEYTPDPKKEIEELLDLYVQDCRKGLLRLEFVMPSLYDKLVEHGIVGGDEAIVGLAEKRDYVFDYIKNLASE